MGPLRSTGYVDPGWEHGVAQDERKKKVKCNYCGKVVSGGIFRLKQHLARISGEVTHCDKVPEEVCFSMRKNLEGCRSGRKRRQSEYDEMPLVYQSNDYNDMEETPGSYKEKGKKVMCDKNFVIRFAPLRSLGYVDPGWEHCVAQDEKKKKVKCNYCEKTISGGINRFKQHLARIPGEVAYCDKAPEEVYLKIKENMKWHRTGRRHRKPDTKEISAFYMHSDNEDEEEEQEGGFLQCATKDVLAIDDKISDNDDIRNYRGRCGSSGNSVEPRMRKSRLDSVFLKSLKSQTSSQFKQVKAKMVSEKKARKEAISAICKFFYYAGVPSSAADSPYFHKMLELVGQYGQGLQSPSSQLISGWFLQDEINTTKEYLAEFRASWAITGCSMMADSWNDIHGRTLINFLVSCPRGLYFVSSVDATDIIEDAESLFKLLDRMVDEIGEENVVQVITKSTASFKTAGKMLEEKRRHLFWTPCAAHCIDRMLEDFLNIKWIGECINKAKRITRLIYNNTWLLSFMKKEFTGGQELLKPAVTKFATTFFSLDSLLDHKNDLKKMFQSNKWLSSPFAKSDEAKEVEKIILNVPFWKKLQFVRKSLEPVAHVLQKIESDEIQSMPCIYGDMCRAKFEIKSIHGDDARKYGPVWGVIENHWNSLFHHPLYVAAYFLNPSYRCRTDFIVPPEVIRGLNECIVRLEADNGKRISASMQIPDFVSAKADFGTDLAVSTRMELDPAAWWQQHGISCLELQRIAIRILSQTCSSIGCEHTWSTYDQFRSKRHNCQSRKRWNELTYAHYNLRLREHQLGVKPGESFSFDSFMIESILDDWLVEAEKQAVQEDEEIVDSEMEQFYGDEMDENDHTDKRPAEMVTLAGVVEPFETSPAAAGVTTDDDGLDFLDDDLTE
uniref:BED-type domain-containing protein n=3 Tax=Rhizophora mucronata TaxID=61149 RepID=A0A2P2KH89_RHIMU